MIDGWTTRHVARDLERDPPSSLLQCQQIVMVMQDVRVPVQVPGTVRQRKN
jgi:hypothetical protein